MEEKTQLSNAHIAAAKRHVDRQWRLRIVLMSIPGIAGIIVFMISSNIDDINSPLLNLYGRNLLTLAAVCLVSISALATIMMYLQTGLWENFDASKLATAEAFRADAGLCWGWYEWRRRKVIQAQPIGAHYAIAQLASHVPKLTVITQNVDDLHERAGSPAVAHLHGSLHSP